MREAKRNLTPEELNQERKYILAMQLADTFLKNGTITQEEYDTFDTIFVNLYCPFLSNL